MELIVLLSRESLHLQRLVHSLSVFVVILKILLDRIITNQCSGEWSRATIAHKFRGKK